MSSSGALCSYQSFVLSCASHCYIKMAVITVTRWHNGGLIDTLSGICWSSNIQLKVKSLLLAAKQNYEGEIIIEMYVDREELWWMKNYLRCDNRHSDHLYQ